MEKFSNIDGNKIQILILGFVHLSDAQGVFYQIGIAPIVDW